MPTSSGAIRLDGAGEAGAAAGQGAAAGGEPPRREQAERWITVVQGHRIEGRFHHAWPTTVVWLDVDGVCVGRAEEDGTVRLPASDGALTNAGWSTAERERIGFAQGATLVVRQARHRPYDMDLVPGTSVVELDATGPRVVALTPPAGSRAERFHAFRERRPRLAAARFLALRLGWLLWAGLGLLVGPLVERLLAWLDRIPWPDLPAIPWPDLSWLWTWLGPLEPVVVWLLDNMKIIGAVIVGLVLARGELTRQRGRKAVAEAERRAELERLARAMRELADRRRDGG